MTDQFEQICERVATAYNFVEGTQKQKEAQQQIDMDALIQMVRELRQLLSVSREAHKLELDAVGGCDHGVGICCCSLISHVQAIDDSIGKEPPK